MHWPELKKSALLYVQMVMCLFFFFFQYQLVSTLMDKLHSCAVDRLCFACQDSILLYLAVYTGLLLKTQHFKKFPSQNLQFILLPSFTAPKNSVNTFIVSTAWVWIMCTALGFWLLEATLLSSHEPSWRIFCHCALAYNLETWFQILALPFFFFFLI